MPKQTVELQTLKWIEEQYGSAGWENKLCRFVEVVSQTHRLEAYKQRLIVKIVKAPISKHQHQTIVEIIKNTN